MTSPSVHVPLRLTPPLSASPVTVVPGVTLHAMGDEDVKSGRFGAIPKLPPFEPNTLLRIEADVYEPAARSRLEPKGVYQRNPVIKEDGSTFVSAQDTARWILTALILNSPFQFEFGPHYRTLRNPSTNQEDIVFLGRVEWHRARFLSAPRVPSHVNPAQLTKVAIRIEEYFRRAPFRMDRIAVALATYWTAACASYPEQTFLGLCIVLESLLSTSEQEVTHQLAERAGVLARALGGNGVAAYKAIKRLYGIRSNIVHGRGASKDAMRHVKRQQRTKSPLVAADVDLLLHPMARILSVQDFQEAWGATVHLFLNILFIDSIYNALRSGDDKVLDAIFLSELVGADPPEQEPPPDTTEGST